MTTVFQLQKHNTMFPELSDTEVDSLEIEFGEKYARKMRDTSLPIDQRHLKHLVQEMAKPQDREWELWAVQQIPIRRLLPQLQQHSLEIYLAMQRSNKWGAMGEGRISMSFCRHILNIPPDQHVTNQDLINMDFIIKRTDKDLGYRSGEELIKHCIERDIFLFGQNYTSFDDLENFIKLMDAPYYFYSNSAGAFCGGWIFGEIVWSEIANKKFYTFKHEWSRSPGHMLGFVGRAGPPIQIREEAIDQIFYSKWVPVDGSFLRFVHNKFPYDLNGFYKNCPNGFIQNTLELIAMKKNGLITRKAALRVKHSVKGRMIDGVLYHELGHQISHQIVGPVYVAVYDTFSTADNLLLCLGEAMADWAPFEKDGCQGAFLRWTEIFVTDIASADCCAWLYPTDNWHVADEDAEFLPYRSDVLCSLFFLVTRGIYVDFLRVISLRPKIFDFLKGTLILVVEKLMDFIFSARYEKEGKKHRYADIEPELIKKHGKTTRAELHQVFMFWRDIRDWLRADEKQWNKIQNILTKEAKNFQKKLLDMINEQDQGHYTSLREFILKKCQEIHECIVKNEEE
jgi:hypothetical protein